MRQPEKYEIYGLGKLLGKADRNPVQGVGKRFTNRFWTNIARPDGNNSFGVQQCVRNA